MKKKSTFACLATAVFLLFGFASIFAQGTANSGVILRVTIDGVAYDYYNEECGYGTADWGGSPANFACNSNVAWAYDISPVGPTDTSQDSLTCDSVPAQSLNGKVAFIRRGVCAFSIKALNAQKAGAVAVLIANNSGTAGQTDCSIQNMPAAQPQAGETTIPCFFLCRKVATQIDNAIKANKPIQICMLRPDLDVIDFFYTPSSKRTPVSQIGTDTFGFSARVINPGSVERTNVVVTAKVENASGQELFSVSENIASIPAGGLDTITATFGNQLYAPELPVGEYKLVYTTVSDSIDTAPVKERQVGSFSVTQNLFSKDDGATIAFRPGSFSGDTWGVGNVYTMRAGSLDAYEVRTTEFTFTTNAADLPVSDVASNIYLFKIFDDVILSDATFDRTQFFSTSMELKGSGTYEAPANLAGFTIQQAQITDLDDLSKGVRLDAGSRYMLVAEYGSVSINTFHGFDQDLPHPGVSSVVFNGTWFLGGFQGDPSAVLRMYIDLLLTTDEKPLPESVMNIFPNPVRDVLNLGISFDLPTDATITIADINGRTIQIEDRQGLTNETLTYQLPQLASGTYLARIATKEGTRTKKFVVQK